MFIHFKIPGGTVVRLSVYSRYLNGLKRNGVHTISSSEIAKGVGVSSAQVRKDIALFGEFGTRGVGYNLEDLDKEILAILGLDSTWNVALVGMGHLGCALASYKSFKQRNFNLTCTFDNDPQKIGKKINDIEILSVERLEEIVTQKQIRIGVVTVPSEVAQEMTNLLIRAGVQAILNFAPTRLDVPPEIVLRNVDLAVNLELFSFNIK